MAGFERDERRAPYCGFAPPYRDSFTARGGGEKRNEEDHPSPPFFLPFNPPLVWLNSVRELENDFSIRFPLLGEGEPICDLSSSLFLLLLLLLMFFASLFEKKN